MKQSQLKMILAAMIVTLIATMAVAAPAEKPHTTSTHVGKHNSNAKPHHSTSSHHHTTTTHHSKPKDTKTKGKKKPTSSSKAHKPKKTITKAHRSTTKAKKPKTTTTTTSHTTTTTVAPTTSATPKPKPGTYGQTGTIVDQTDFCIFLPPTVGGWVQITGRIDRSKYGLSPKDGGGQYDMRAPVGASFTGYNAFVQLTEPDSEIYCIRACMTKADCPVNKSTHGCVKVLGGDYS
ncbi:hypothetical protein BGX29_008742 [Mortierella sp. GBA35]|nr:hypothetical protein BGX29_008742 [Mortierella sp. GBA35]